MAISQYDLPLTNYWFHDANADIISWGCNYNWMRHYCHVSDQNLSQLQTSCWPWLEIRATRLPCYDQVAHPGRARICCSTSRTGWQLESRWRYLSLAELYVGAARLEDLAFLLGTNVLHLCRYHHVLYTDLDGRFELHWPKCAICTFLWIPAFWSILMRWNLTLQMTIPICKNQATERFWLGLSSDLLS
jgi:hypothetical protein